MRTRIIILLLSCFVFVGLAQAQKERKHIRKGNRSYKAAYADSAKVDSAMFQQAEVDYRKALEKDPNSWDATYNLGNSLFRQGKYEEAMRQYQAASAMSIDEKGKLAQAFHNLGNTMLQGNQLDGAIEAYKNALRNNPKDMETKYNLAWAQNKKQEQQQQQQQNQDQQQQDQQNKDQQKQDQDQQQQDQQDQQQQQDQQKQQQDQDQQQQQKQEQQAQQQEENKISKEDAQRILEALQNQEKDVQKKVQKQKAKPKKVTLEKDW